MMCANNVNFSQRYPEVVVLRLHVTVVIDRNKQKYPQIPTDLSSYSLCRSLSLSLSTRNYVLFFYLKLLFVIKPPSILN